MANTAISPINERVNATEEQCIGNPEGFMTQA